MKNIVFAITCAIMVCFTASANQPEIVTNVYNFTSSLKVPYLENGIRTYKSQSLKGYLYVEIIDGQTEEMWLVTQNSKTKTVHVTYFYGGFYNLMGKANKYSDRTVPTVFYQAWDVDISDDSHEYLKNIQFAGTGSLKTVKKTVNGCTMCGEPTKVTTYCNILQKMNGYVTGVMDCMCPDEEDGWSHTLKTTLCGVYYDDDGSYVRSHDAAVWGTWSASFNEKMSDTKLK